MVSLMMEGFPSLKKETTVSRKAKPLNTSSFCFCLITVGNITLVHASHSATSGIKGEKSSTSNTYAYIYSEAANMTRGIMSLSFVIYHTK